MPESADSDPADTVNFGFALITVRTSWRMRWWQAVVHAGGVLLMDCIGYSRLISDLVRAAGWFWGLRGRVV